ncbi:MAG TPA: hypothetical protein VMA73_20410 [Streptosporangiaceae bacterium]|nr:hypothetical protein [Streptosporangiaceae bacterium]
MNESYAERGYATGGKKSTRAGGVIITTLALLSTFLVIWGLYYATGTGERHKVALAAAGCEPNLLSVNVGCTTVWMLERRYTSITTPAVQQLNTDVAAYTAKERHSLAAAEAALRAEVASASAFDTSLAQFPFPPVVAPMARALIQAIHSRIKLTAEQARSSSLAQLRSFNDRVKAAGAAIQTEMKLVHKALYTRPTVNQEP